MSKLGFKTTAPAALCALTAVAALHAAGADESTATAWATKPGKRLTYEAARAEAEKRLTALGNEHAHEQCNVHERALATVKVQAEASSAEQRAEWRLVVSRSEVELERCYREAMAGLAMLIGRMHLLERWGFAKKPGDSNKP